MNQTAANRTSDIMHRLGDRAAKPDTESITLTREEWDEVRRAILSTSERIRDVGRKHRLAVIYEQMVNQGAEQATDKVMGQRYPPACAVCVHRAATGLVDGQPRCEEHRPAPTSPADWAAYTRGTEALLEQMRKQ